MKLKTYENLVLYGMKMEGKACYLNYLNVYLGGGSLADLNIRMIGFLFHKHLELQHLDRHQKN